MSKSLMEAAEKAKKMGYKGKADVSAGPDKPDIETDPSLVQEGAETLFDVLTVMPQSASLEWADEAVSKINPKLGEQYRAAVNAARERSPNATTLAEMFTPDVLSVVSPILKASKIPKLLGKLPTDTIPVSMLKSGVKSGSEGAATSAIMQAGDKGEVSGADVMGSGFLSGVGGAATGVVKNYSAMRSKTTGTDDIIDAFDTKAPKGGQIDYMMNMMKNMESDHNLFQGGKVELDPVSLKFKPVNPAYGAMGKVVPPSNKELFSRVEKMKKGVHNQVQGMLENQSKFSFSGLEGTPFMEQMKRQGVNFDASYPESKGIFYAGDFANDIEDIVNSVPLKSEKQGENIRKALQFQMSRVFGDTMDSEANFLEMDQLKKNLYELINYAKRNNKTAQEAAYTQFAKVVKDKIEANLEGAPKMQQLNRLYGDLSIMSDAINEKMKKGDSTRISKGAMANNAIYKAGAIMESLRDVLLGPVSQVSSAVQNTPALSEMGSAFIRKAIPVSSRSEEIQVPMRPDRSPDAVSAMQPLPLKLQNMRLPRTVEGVLSNPKVVLAKLAQENPELFDQVNFVLQNRPEDMREILPLIIEMNPSLFEKDRYNRIDNIVPADKVPMVMEEIRKNDSLSPTQKVNKLDLLNRTGEYYDN